MFKNIELQFEELIKKGVLSYEGLSSEGIKELCMLAADEGKEISLHDNFLKIGGSKDD